MFFTLITIHCNSELKVDLVKVIVRKVKTDLPAR